jgi:integrase/recombinase XerD
MKNSVMQATTKIILDTRRVKKQGTFPVKLRVIFRRATKDYPTIYSLSKEDFDKLTAPRINHNQKKQELS